MGASQSFLIGVMLFACGCQAIGQREAPAPASVDTGPISRAAADRGTEAKLSAEQELRFEAIAQLAAEDLATAQTAGETAATATNRAAGGLSNLSRDVRPSMRR